jgi:hypothetical protein
MDIQSLADPLINVTADNSSHQSTSGPTTNAHKNSNNNSYALSDCKSSFIITGMDNHNVNLIGVLYDGCQQSTGGLTTNVAYYPQQQQQQQQ